MARVAVTMATGRTGEGGLEEVVVGVRRGVAGRDFKLGMEALLGDERC